MGARPDDEALERLAQVILNDYILRTHFLPQRLSEQGQGIAGTAAWERDWRDESAAQARRDAARMYALLTDPHRLS